MEQPFTAASHHDILVLLVQVAVLLFTARVLGEIAQRWGQPTVVGEILAGIILGPSLLSGFVPFINEWMIPQTPVQGYLLEVISLLGAMFLLLITGLETDIPLIRQQARSAIGVALGGLLLPLSLGFILGQMLPDDMLVQADQRLVFSLFLAAAMSISAIPVIAKVLMDLHLTRRNIGQSLIAAAMIDDTTGWIILSIVIGIAGGTAVTAGGIVQSVGSVLAFMILSLTLGQYLVRQLFNFVQNRVIGRDKFLALIIFLMFVWGAIGQALELEALLGAFVLGILFSRVPQLSHDVVHKLESFTLGIFAPIFFAVAGLKVNALSLLEPRLLAITGVIIVVATIAKVVGVYFGSRWIGGSDHWTAVFYGAGLNARGSMGIIIATIGLSLGVLTQDMFSMFVLMAVITSLMAPAFMRLALNNIQPGEEELARLLREEMNRTSLIANVHRVLLPVRRREDNQGGAIQTIEASILQRMGVDRHLSVTLLNVSRPGEETNSTSFLQRLSKNFEINGLVSKVVHSDQPHAAILEEARKDYDLLIIGASERNRGADVLFTPLVDQLIRLAPCPTIIVHGARVQADWEPKRILIPTNGTRAARRAAEVAFELTTTAEEEVFILSVVREGSDNYFLDPSGTLGERQLTIAHQMVDELRVLGETQNVRTFGDVELGDVIEAKILDYAREHRIDLIVLGTNVHAGGDRLYLGPRVERIITNAPCPVIIVNSN